VEEDSCFSGVSEKVFWRLVDGWYANRHEAFEERRAFIFER
jgi:hypothetical protein